MVDSGEVEWQSYEQVAGYLLERLASVFSLGIVEGKQIVPGKSGAKWEIDAKGLKEDADGFIIIECRRYTNSRVAQEQMGAIAFRVHDTGAGGAILVSPFDPQKGAQKVAAHEGIITVTLSPDSTTTYYVLTFLNKIFVGLSGTLTVSGSLDAAVVTAFCNSDKHLECKDKSCGCKCHRTP